MNKNDHFWPVIDQSIGSTLVSWVQGTGLVSVYMIPSFFPLLWGQKKLPYAIGLLLVLFPLGILKARKFITKKSLDELAKATEGVRFVNFNY